jgi:predicted helicase
MRFGKKIADENSKSKNVDDKSIINYNNKITISNIPAKAYEYVVNGKSAIEWIMERYQISTHKESGIVNNPNDWANETGNPRYILDLLLSVINVSMQTVEIVNSLPKVDFGSSSNESEIVKMYPAQEESDEMIIAAEPEI